MYKYSTIYMDVWLNNFRCAINIRICFSHIEGCILPSRAERMKHLVVNVLKISEQSWNSYLHLQCKSTFKKILFIQNEYFHTLIEIKN